MLQINLMCIAYKIVVKFMLQNIIDGSSTSV